MDRTKRTRASGLTAAVGYLCLHVAIIIGSVLYARGNQELLVATGLPSLAYYLLVVSFGASLVAITSSAVSKRWWVVGGALIVVLFTSRYASTTVAGVLTTASLVSIVVLPYVVAATVAVRLLVGRFGGERFAGLPTHPVTRRGMFVAGVILVTTVGGSIAAVATAPSPIAPESWSTDQQLEYLERTDQRDRETGAVADRSRDYRRAERVLSLLTTERVETPDEWLDAAVVLQHGTCPEHFEVAHRLALAANESTGGDATRWVHLTYDRWQVSLGEPQRYGTQVGTLPVDAECYPTVPSGLNVSEVVA